MITKEKARELVLDLFEEEALVIGGLAAVHGLDDDLVWRLMRNLDVILDKSLRRLESSEASPAKADRDAVNTKPHPAIEDFLLKLRRA
ncbi:MAG TPA: hypothetical protein DEB40_03265 [Elusimicrobia bacterium]|nr:hypothetical protein [Elusimicrobiota bacterium]HBT60750.1 hypothetical protein [Elusimicrobiota bacterium]